MDVYYPLKEIFYLIYSYCNLRNKELGYRMINLGRDIYLEENNGQNEIRISL